MADSMRKARPVALWLAASVLAGCLALIPCGAPAWASAPGPDAAGSSAGGEAPSAGSASGCIAGGADDVGGEGPAGEAATATVGADDGSAGAAVPDGGEAAEGAEGDALAGDAPAMGEAADPAEAAGGEGGGPAFSAGGAVQGLGAWMAKRDAQALAAAKSAASAAAGESADERAGIPLPSVIAGVFALACACGAAACFASGRSRRASAPSVSNLCGKCTPLRTVNRENEGSLCL